MVHRRREIVVRRQHDLVAVFVFVLQHAAAVVSVNDLLAALFELFSNLFFVYLGNGETGLASLTRI